VMASYRRKGKESGLNMVEYSKVQTRLGYLDTEKTRVSLGYPKGDLDLALQETVEASL
jgi:hypothetical protein